MINSQLSKLGIRWPVSPECIAGSGVDASSSSIFLSYPLFLKKIYMKYVVFMCRTIKILVSNWPRTRKFSQLITGKEDSCSWLFSPWWHVGHALRPIFMVWLVKICQVSSCRKFMQHLEFCYFDSWSWQSFVSTCDVFNCLFLLDVQNEIQLLSRFFWTSWLVCLLRFWLRNAPLVKVTGNPISDGIVFKNELTHLPLFEA